MIGMQANHKSEEVITMAFGVKMRVVKTKGAYSIQDLYDRIKDVHFDAGVPAIAKHGAVTLIAFPALDGENQCIIQGGSFKSPYKKFQVLKTRKVGVANAVGQEVLNSVTDGWSVVRGVVGNNQKIVQQQVDEVADKLEDMGL